MGEHVDMDQRARIVFLLLSGWLGVCTLCAPLRAQQGSEEKAAWNVTLKPDFQATSNLDIHNECKRTHTFNITPVDVPFLQLLAKPQATVPGHSSQALPVRFDTTGMALGQYQGTVLVKCETCRKEPTCHQDRSVLPVHLTIFAPPETTVTPAAPTPPSPPAPQVGPRESEEISGHAQAMRKNAEEFRRLAREALETAKNTSDPTNRLMWEETARQRQQQAEACDQAAKDLEGFKESVPAGPVVAPVSPPGPTEADRKLAQDLIDSARFWHEEAEKARRYAREATDPKTRKTWEDEAKWDEANARRREEAAGHLLGHPVLPPGTIPANPPLPETPTTPPVENPTPVTPIPQTPTTVSPPVTPPTTVTKPPENPTPVTPPENPPPVTPPVTPPSNPMPTHTTEVSDCPQRDKPCAALILDFSKAVWYEPDFQAISRKLRQLQCDVDYVTPDFKVVPEAYLIGVTVLGKEIGKKVYPDKDEVKAARDHNRSEWAKVWKAIGEHRAKLRGGLELGIEMFRGHGSCSDVESNKCAYEDDRFHACGILATHHDSGDYIDRCDFHQNNYKAANKNVCDWVVVDFSCYAGLTAKAIDELENRATATCSMSSTIDCPLHAGWEADMALTDSTADARSTNGDASDNASYIESVLSEEVSTWVRENFWWGSINYQRLAGKLLKNADQCKGGYSDHGYAKDNPPAHTRTGY